MSRCTALERTQMCLSEEGLPFEFFLPIQTNMYLLVPTLSHISFHPLSLCAYKPAVFNYSGKPPTCAFTNHIYISRIFMDYVLCNSYVISLYGLHPETIKKII